MHTRLLTRPRRRRPRGGFTLVELMVAVVIMTVGVLGLAGSSVIVSRLVGGAGQRTLAANVAASRFERLRGLRCVTPGTATSRGITESWKADTLFDGVTKVVRETVSITDSRGNTSQQIFRTSMRVSC